MSGGKGGSSSSQVQIPDWIKEPAQRNIARAEQLQQIGYIPYMGPEVAAFTPGQEQMMRSTANTAQSLGIVGSDYDPMSGMPQGKTTMGGVTGYSSYPGYEAALAEFAAKRPGQYLARETMTMDPITGQTFQQYVQGGGPETNGGVAPQVGGGPEGEAIGSNPYYDMGYVPGFAAGFGRMANQGMPSIFGAIGDAAMGGIYGMDYNPVTGDYENRDYMDGGSEGYTTVSGSERGDGGYDSYSDAGKAATDRGETFF